jgi:hypothetical protein
LLRLEQSEIAGNQAALAQDGLGKAENIEKVESPWQSSINSNESLRWVAAIFWISLSSRMIRSVLAKLIHQPAVAAVAVQTSHVPRAPPFRSPPAPGTRPRMCGRRV